MATESTVESAAREVDLATVDLTDLDQFVEGFPHQTFAALRQQAPVFWHAPTVHTPDGVGFWVLSGHAEVLAAVSDAATFSSDRAPGADGGGTLIQDLPHGFAAGVLLNMMDDPRHHRIRKLVTPSVTPRAVAGMEEELRRRAVAILDAASQGGAGAGAGASAGAGAGGDESRCDFLTDVALELPVQATLILLGVPEDDRHQLVAHTNTILAYEDRELGEETEGTRDAAAAMSAYAAALIEERRRRPGDDLLSAVVQARVESDDGVEEPLSELELLMFFSLLVAAGSETTRNAIALGMAALIEHPDQLDLLVREPSTVPGAVEEILRWSSPTLYNRRTAVADTELGGVSIAAGDKVTLWWASADFDERVFADPFRFDVTRDPNPHLAFGYRSHFCLGANLARTEIRIMFEEILSRFDSFALNGPIRRVRTNKHAGVSSMPISWRRRA